MQERHHQDPICHVALAAPGSLAPLADSTRSRTNSVAVAERRSRTSPNRSSIIEDVVPCDEEVDGGDLLGDLVLAIGGYIKCSPESLLAVALWVLFTYCFREAYISPILAITSPEKGCGKSNLLTVLRWLVWRPLIASSVTPAVVYRLIELHHPTLLIDEADTFIRARVELVGILNSGHTPGGAFVFRSAPNSLEPERFSTWCPKAIAAIGNLPETIEHRSVRIRLRRALRSERVNELREYRLDAEFEDLRRRSARWAVDNMLTVKDADPALPSELDHRPRDNWRPLIAIADICGAQWGQRARDAAVALSGGMKENTKSENVELLEDIRAILRSWPEDKVSSEDLVNALVARKDRPWNDLDYGRPLSQAKMAKMLTRYQRADGATLRTRSVWIRGHAVRGYFVHDFEDAFARYLPEVREVRDGDTSATEGEPGRE